MRQLYVLLAIIVTMLAAALAVALFMALLPLLKVIADIAVGLLTLCAVYVVAIGLIDLRRRWHHSGVIHLTEHGAYALHGGRHEPLHPASVHAARYKVVEALPVSPMQQALPAPDTIETPAAIPTFAELLAENVIGHGTMLLLGYVDGGPRQGTWLDLYSCAVAGLQGSGKTTTELFIILQSVLHGAMLLIIDPHRDTAQDSLGGRLAPLASRFLRPIAADDDKDILATIKLVRREVDSRRRGATGAPIILVVDEFTRLMRRSPAIKDKLSACIEEIAQEGRKMQVFALLSGQIWKATAVGGTELRYSLASSFVHRIQEAQSKLLIPGEYAKLTPKLKPGQVYFYDTNGDTELMQIPYTTEQDVLTVARLLTSPSGKTGREYPLSTGESRSVIPIRDDVFSPDESTSKVDGNQIEPALQAKVDKTVEMLGANKGEIIREVWGEVPGKGEGYKKALAEYEEVMRIIACLAKREA